MANEKGWVVAVGPGAEGCDVTRISLRCDMCDCRTVMIKRRKARRLLTIHTRSRHQQNNVVNNVMAHVQNWLRPHHHLQGYLCSAKY